MLAGAALGLALLAVVAAGALAWRLSQGPLDVAWLARMIESHVKSSSPTRLHIGEASIAWAGYQAGADQGLQIRLQDLRVVNQTGTPGAELKEADLTLSLGRLLEFQLVPRTVSVTGLRLRALRSEDGSIALDLGNLADSDTTGPHTSPSFAQTMDELRKPAGTDRRQGVPGLEMLTQLQHVRMHDAKVEVVDRLIGDTLRTDVADLDLTRQRGGGVKGVADGTIGLGGATASLHLQADLAAGGGTHLAVTLAPLNSTALAEANPALAGVGALQTTVQAKATLELSPNLRPRAGELHATAGDGRVQFRGGVAPFQSLALDAAATWQGGDYKPVKLELQRLKAVLASPRGAWSSTVGLTGEADRKGGKLSGQFELTLDHADFADLPALWPAAWGGHTRPWITQNITAGIARDGDFKFTLEGPEDNPSAIDLTQASGTLQGDDVTIWWLRPVPPVEHAQAVLRLQGPDVLEISIPTAKQQGTAIALKDGLVRFTGLQTKDQFMTVTTGVAGSVPDVLTVLKNPRLHLLDKRPVTFRNPAGTVVSKLEVDMPMKKEVKFEQLKIEAQGKISGLRLGGLVAGRDLDKSEVQFDVTQDGMKATGTGAVANIASAIGVDMDFKPGPPSQVLLHATLDGKATARDLAAAGIDPGDVMTAGSINLGADYSQRRDNQAEVKLTGDFKNAGIAFAGWRKPPGLAASASGTLLLKNDKLAGITKLEAQGPNMHVVGQAEMTGNRPTLMRFDRIELGLTQGSGELRFPPDPAQPLRLTLSGAVLDLSTQFGSKPSEPARSPRPKGNEAETPWIADVKFDRVLLAHQLSIGGVVAHAEYNGRILTALRAESSGAEHIQAVIEKQGNGRRVSVRAADGGLLFRALDVLDTVAGGSLALEAHYDDRYADPPLSGTLDMSEFGLRNAVAVGKLLQAVTVYGITEAMQGGDTVMFSRLIMPFRYAGDVLDIGESRAFSASLGVTAQGRLDIGRHHMDVKGTIVPAYVINSALGNIPLVGRLFSPERGGGLVSVDYTIRGSLSDPSVSVNPLSALTPGILRGIFKIF